jgi:ferric-dicitrate binding protein FerR (iron transport regulator)
MSLKEKTWAQSVQEDTAVHAAENAAWYAHLQKEQEEAQRKAEKRAWRAATESLSASYAVTHEVVALFQHFFNAHIERDDDDNEHPPKKMKQPTADPITADDAVRLFAAASYYYVRIHLEGDVFNMNGSSTNFAKRTYHWAKTVLKPKYGNHLDIDAIANAIDAL